MKNTVTLALILPLLLLFFSTEVLAGHKSLNMRVKPLAKKGPIPKRIQHIPKRISIVKEAQILLNKLGYRSGPADGILGPKTKHAIRRFRNVYRMGNQPIINHKVLEKLRELVTHPHKP